MGMGNTKLLLLFTVSNIEVLRDPKCGYINRKLPRTFYSNLVDKTADNIDLIPMNVIKSRDERVH